MARVSVATGAICHRPCSGAPRRPAKHAGESKQHAQPVDRPVARHQRSGLAIADQGVVFDPRGHDG
jgi:hypothetical protein